MDFFDIFVSVLGSAVRLSVPLLFTALAGLFSERAGIFDIGLEGKMLAAAFASACVAYLTGRSEEHTSELQSLMRISYAVSCLNKTQKLISYAILCITQKNKQHRQTIHHSNENTTDQYTLNNTHH